MAIVEILPAAPSKSEPASNSVGCVAYVPPSVPAAVPVTWWATWWKDRARNKLQRELARVIQIAQDHESNNVKPGDPVYQHLYAKALELCQSHFSEWHLKRDDIEIEIPCMRQLRLMAKPEAVVTVRRAPVALLGLVAIVALPLVIGAWCGLFGVGHHWIMHLFGG